GKKYNDVLPAANLVFELPAQQLLRISAAREVARPRMDQMNAGYDFNVSTTTGIPSDTVGNPKLDPWRADALDLSYEKYFANKAYVSFAAFYKNLKSYIYDVTNSSFDLSQFVSQLPPPKPPQVPYQNIGSLTISLDGARGGAGGFSLCTSPAS